MRFAGSVLSHGILDGWCENIVYCTHSHTIVAYLIIHCKHCEHDTIHVSIEIVLLLKQGID